MKICPRCSATQRETANYCIKCGCPINGMSYQGMSTKPKHSLGLGVLIGIIITPIVVIALILCLAFGVFSNTVFKKFTKMVKESETAAEVSEKDSPKDLLPKELLEKLSNVKLTESDLSGYSAADLKTIRNAIYAKHGYIFKSEELKSYFEKYNWYKAQHTDVTKELSPIETANAKFIKSLESRDKTSEAKEKQTSCDEVFEVAIIDPSGSTNIRDKPSGATVMQINGNAIFQVKKIEKGWWRIEGDSYRVEASSYKPLQGSSTGYWIHSSIIAFGTRYDDEKSIKFYSKPDSTSSVVYSVSAEEDSYIPLEKKDCWIKAKTKDGAHSGWIDFEWVTTLGG